MSLLLQMLSSSNFPINLQEFIALMSEHTPHALFIKNQNLEYEYANPFFINLMGLKNMQELIGIKDTALCSDKYLTDRYEAYDLEVLDNNSPIILSETIHPKHNEDYVNTMEGREYPLYLNSDRANFVLGIVQPKKKWLKLDWNMIFNLDHKTLDSLLNKKFWLIKAACSEIRFSKREVQVLITLMKGQHAGEIADTLKLKQTTIESYLVNIKNKAGVNTKLELINFIIDNKLLDQILI